MELCYGDPNYDIVSKSTSGNSKVPCIYPIRDGYDQYINDAQIRLHDCQENVQERQR